MNAGLGTTPGCSLSKRIDSKMSNPVAPKDAQNGGTTTILRGLVGILLGAAVGGLVVWLAARYSLYAMVFPGAAIGIGCSWASKTRSVALATISGIAAVTFSLFLEGYLFPFIADSSFGYFIAHLHQLSPATWIMIGIGTALSVGFGLGSPSHRGSGVS